MGWMCCTVYNVSAAVQEKGLSGGMSGRQVDPDGLPAEWYNCELHHSSQCLICFSGRADSLHGSDTSLQMIYLDVGSGPSAQILPHMCRAALDPR